MQVQNSRMRWEGKGYKIVVVLSLPLREFCKILVHLLNAIDFRIFRGGVRKGLSPNFKDSYIRI